MRTNLLTKLLLLALIVLPATFVVPAGTASAAETQASLRGKLLITAELQRALEKADSQIKFGASEDVDVSTDELVGAGRRWEATDGSVMYVAMQSYKDGSSITRGDRGYLMRGDYARQVMTSGFGSYEEVGDPEEFFDDQDVIQQFTVKRSGKTYDALTVTFISGDIFGIVMYYTPLTNKGVETGAAYGTQWQKLR